MLRWSLLLLIPQHRDPLSLLFSVVLYRMLILKLAQRVTVVRNPKSRRKWRVIGRFGVPITEERHKAVGEQGQTNIPSLGSRSLPLTLLTALIPLHHLLYELPWYFDFWYA